MKRNPYVLAEVRPAGNNLMYDDLTGIVKGKKIAKKTIGIIKQNIIFAYPKKIEL